MKYTEKVDKTWKYKHRSVYVTFVMLGLNLSWYVFIKPPDSTKHFVWGLVTIVVFGIFYYTAKNLKRIYSRKKSLKYKFLDSIAFAPFAYVAFISVMLFIFSIGGYFVDSVSTNKIKKSVGKTQRTIIIGVNPDTKSDSFESDAQNLIFFINVSMSQYALLPLSSELPGLHKNFTQENIIHKKWSPTRRMLIVSILSAAIMQLIAIFIAENIIYKMIRKKKKKSPRRRNRILASSPA